jgi:SAM-dependent methyltransferase
VTGSDWRGSRAEAFFRETGYWRAWSRVPDATADIPYALAAVEPTHHSVLDIPCGRGRLLQAIRSYRNDVRLLGFDINADMARQARGAVAGAQVGVASVYSIPLPDRSVDLVLCHESFMHFEDPSAALRELARVAASALYVSVTTRRQLNTPLRRLRLIGTSDLPHWRYNIEDLCPLLASCEFDWTVVGAFLFGSKALRLSHETHRQWHERFGRRLPQWLLRRFGQTLFVYGRRRAAPA